MNIGDSELFKSFSRPILDSILKRNRNANNQTGTERNGLNTDRNVGDGTSMRRNCDDGPSLSRHAADGVVHKNMAKANLDATLLSVTNATTDSFTLTIEGRITGTGPAFASIGSVKLALLYEWCCFGELFLPDVKLRPWGGSKVQIQDLNIEIHDMLWFKPFIHGVILSDSVRCSIEDGKCTITTFGLFKHEIFPLCFPIEIKGMKGPHAAITKVQHLGFEVTLTFHIINPSPVEINYGRGRFELDRDRILLAELAGEFNIVRGEFEAILKGRHQVHVPNFSKAKLKGVGSADAISWCSKVIQLFEIDVELTPSFHRGLLDNGAL